MKKKEQDMTYADIKDKLRKPTQFICAEISIQRRYYSSGNEVLLDDVKWWLQEIEKTEPDQDGCFSGPFLIVRCKGTKEGCQQVAREERLYLRCHGSRSRVAQLGLWRTTWMVLPADELGNWVPTKGMVEKALALLEDSQK